MSGHVSRRKLIKTGLGAVGAAGGLGAAVRLADRFGFIPANHRADLWSERNADVCRATVLTKLPSMAREFDRSHISTVSPVNGEAPKTEPYQRLMAGGFADWRLTIDGMVARPSSLSLAELKSFPSRSQITHQACEEGWSFIAEWTGVPLSYVLERVGIHPNARYVFFFAFDDWWDSIDMDDALHPQTLLAYAMNGPDMPIDHGAPLRLKVSRQLGYKSLKYLSNITVTNTAKGIRDGLGSGLPADGYSCTLAYNEQSIGRYNFDLAAAPAPPHAAPDCPPLVHRERPLASARRCVVCGVSKAPYF